MKRVAPLLIILFIAYDVFIRFYADTPVVIFGRTEDGYNYGHLYSLIIASIIPVVLAEGKDRYIAWATLCAMILNYFDVYYYNPTVFEKNDMLLVPLAGVWIYGVINNFKNTRKYSIPLILILPVLLLSRNALYYTNPYGIKYLMAAGDAFVFFLVSVYAGFKLLNKQQALVFLFFMLCMNNLLDNTLYDPYSLGYNELIFAGVITIDAILMAIRKRFAKTAAAKQLHRHIFIAVNLLILLVLIFIPWL